jgi:hypothetical protein
VVPSIEPLKKYWVSKAMVVLGMGWAEECILETKAVNNGIFSWQQPSSQAVHNDPDAYDTAVQGNGGLRKHHWHQER